MFYALAFKYRPHYGAVVALQFIEKLILIDYAVFIEAHWLGGSCELRKYIKFDWVI
jgi:ABC-type polysaccharide transport system permease subunit